MKKIIVFVSAAGLFAAAITASHAQVRVDRNGELVSANNNPTTRVTVAMFPTAGAHTPPALPAVWVPAIR